MLKDIIDWFFADILTLEADWVEPVSFFIYDSIKILLLLFVMIGILSFVRTFLPEHKIRGWLKGHKYGAGNVVASSFGVLTPFCSCSSIPIFLSFIRAGVPIGISFSFLITSPLVNEYLVVLMLGFFGWKITLSYVITGILIGTLVGVMLGRLPVERYLVQDVASRPEKAAVKGLRKRMKHALDEALELTRKVWIWVLVGVGIGAMIHNLVPTELVHSLMEKGGAFSVPLAALLGIPIYGSCAAIVPIAVALFEKGIPLGAALAFMMSASALSLPQAVILRRAMKLRLILIFFAIVAAAIVLIGYLYNSLQGLFA